MARMKEMKKGNITCGNVNKYVLNFLVKFNLTTINGTINDIDLEIIANG